VDYYLPTAHHDPSAEVSEDRLGHRPALPQSLGDLFPRRLYVETDQTVGDDLGVTGRATKAIQGPLRFLPPGDEVQRLSGSTLDNERSSGGPGVAQAAHENPHTRILLATR
jgi:hypothetical protein